MNLSKLSPTEKFFKTTILLLLISVVGAVFLNWPDGIKKALLGFWIIVPPTWLWYEFCFLFEKGKTPFSNEFEKFKYAQELSKNLWLSISAILLLVYFDRLPGL